MCISNLWRIKLGFCPIPSAYEFKKVRRIIKFFLLPGGTTRISFEFAFRYITHRNSRKKWVKKSAILDTSRSIDMRAQKAINIFTFLTLLRRRRNPPAIGIFFLFVAHIFLSERFESNQWTLVCGRTRTGVDIIRTDAKAICVDCASVRLVSSSSSSSLPLCLHLSFSLAFNRLDDENDTGRVLSRYSFQKIEFEVWSGGILRGRGRGTAGQRQKLIDWLEG